MESTITIPRCNSSQVRLFVVAALSCAMVLFGDVNGWISTGSSVSPAQARIGRPLTPFSVAGVARRAHRRSYYGHGYYGHGYYGHGYHGYYGHRYYGHRRYY